MDLKANENCLKGHIWGKHDITEIDCGTGSSSECLVCGKRYMWNDIVRLKIEGVPFKKIEMQTGKPNWPASWHLDDGEEIIGNVL